MGAVKSDPHELVGHDIIVEYRLHVTEVVTLRFATVLKGQTPDGTSIVISIEDTHIYAIRERTPRRGWRRWPLRKQVQ